MSYFSLNPDTKNGPKHTSVEAVGIVAVQWITVGHVALISGLCTQRTVCVSVGVCVCEKEAVL